MRHKRCVAIAWECRQARGECARRRARAWIQKEFLSYGPYIDLPKGRYTVQVDYASTAGGNRWDLGVLGVQIRHRFRLGGEVEVSSKGRIEYAFEINRDLQLFEVRTWFGGAGSLMIRSLQIRREL